MVKATEDVELGKLKLKLQSKKAVIGFDTVLKGLRQGKLKKVFLASNCPPVIKNEITHYAKLVQVPIAVMEQNNEEFGVFCKKNFLVAVAGLTEE